MCNRFTIPRRRQDKDGAKLEIAQNLGAMSINLWVEGMAYHEYSSQANRHQHLEFEVHYSTR